MIFEVEIDYALFHQLYIHSINIIIHPSIQLLGLFSFNSISLQHKFPAILFFHVLE